MKVIIAGGRDYNFDETDFMILRGLNNDYNFTEIISGGASGADYDGESFAEINGITTKCFSANWKKYGKSAGPIRNKQMAKYADAVILFPGGKGTASMRKYAEQYNLKVLYDRQAPNK